MNHSGRLRHANYQPDQVQPSINRRPCPAFLTPSCLQLTGYTKTFITSTALCEFTTGKLSRWCPSTLSQHSILSSLNATVTSPLNTDFSAPPTSLSSVAPPTPASSARDEYEHAPEHYGFIHVATITSAHGVHGGVKVTSVSDFTAHRLSGTNPSTRFLKLRHRRYPRPVEIKYSKQTSHADIWIVHFEGMKSRDDFKLLQLQGAKIYVRGEEDKPPLARGEYVALDLVNVRVALKLNDTENEQDAQCSYRTQTKRGEVVAGKVIGVVEEIMGRSEICQDEKAASIANDVLQIALFQHDQLQTETKFSASIPDDATRVLVPFVKELVPIVDLSVSLIVLDPPPGLLDVAIVNNRSKPKPPRGLLMPASCN